MRVQPANPTCPAGSGKTTLLNSLAGQVPRQERLHLSGRVLVNGLPSGHAGHRQGYVQQEDLFYSQLTVKWAFCDSVAVCKQEHCVLTLTFCQGLCAPIKTAEAPVSALCVQISLLGYMQQAPQDTKCWQAFGGLKQWFSLTFSIGVVGAGKQTCSFIVYSLEHLTV